MLDPGNYWLVRDEASATETRRDVTDETEPAVKYAERFLKAPPPTYKLKGNVSAVYVQLYNAQLLEDGPFTKKPMFPVGLRPLRWFLQICCIIF